jgi:hypothetical protein
MLWAVKALPAFPAPIRANRDEKQNPEFQQPSALGAMHVRASTMGTGSFGVIDE